MRTLRILVVGHKTRTKQSEGLRLPEKAETTKHGNRHNYCNGNVTTLPHYVRTAYLALHPPGSGTGIDLSHEPFTARPGTTALSSEL